MTVTNAFLDMYLSQGMSSLSRRDLPSVLDCVESASNRLQDFAFYSMFRMPIAKLRPLLMGVIRRAHFAAAEYENGRAEFAKFVSRPQNDDCRAYFTALYHFEICATLVAQAYQLVSQVAKLLGITAKLYERGSGTPAQRLIDEIYSTALKHWDTTILNDSHVQAFWLTNDGIASQKAVVTWEELSAMIRDISRSADHLVGATADPNYGDRLRHEGSTSDPDGRE